MTQNIYCGSLVSGKGTRRKDNSVAADPRSRSKGSGRGGPDVDIRQQFRAIRPLSGHCKTGEWLAPTRCSSSVRELGKRERLGSETSLVRLHTENDQECMPPFSFGLERRQFDPAQGPMAKGSTLARYQKLFSVNYQRRMREPCGPYCVHYQDWKILLE